MELGRLERIDPRSVWGHEAQDLTPWLLANSDVLGEALGIDLELTGAEHRVGAFSLDLIGRDLTHDCVLIVENQLAQTDHTHLGQLITYAAGTNAGTVVWVAPEFREEHREALNLLNALGGEEVRFFGVQLGVGRIGGSQPAPLFELQAQPNDWAAQVSSSANAASRRTGKSAAYGEFWMALLERIQTEHPAWTRARKPGTDSWFAMRSAFPGAGYSVSFARGDQLRSELYIDHADGERVVEIFAALHRRKASIEDVYGGPLSWEELPNSKASRVADYASGQVLETGRHDEFIAWFIDSQARLRRAIDGVLDDVRVELDAPARPVVESVTDDSADR